MQSIDRLTIAGLLIIGLCLCLANVWYAAARSTIPLAFSGTVTKKWVGTEKHPGVDDANMLTLENHGTICVDRLPFEQIHIGDRIEKKAWARELRSTSRVVELQWSRDFYGLASCMAATIVIMAWMTRSATLSVRHQNPTR